MNETPRPDFVDDSHLDYLDALRESGVTNMFGARPFLQEADPDLSRDEAEEVLLYWMRTFSERHSEMQCPDGTRRHNGYRNTD